MNDETEWVTVCDLHDPPGVRLRKIEEYFEAELRGRMLELGVEPSEAALRQVEERAATAYAHIFGTH